MLRLYSFWRSSASYRVRIALNLKQLPYEYVPVHLTRDGGEQNKPEYRALNPQGRVPLLVDGEFRLGQSMAILDYLESRFPSPALLPGDPVQRARILAFCHAIAADIQPLQNTGPLTHLVQVLGVTEAQRDDWARHWIQRGLEALETEAARQPTSACVFGDEPTLADCVLVPQIYNAERYHCDPRGYPRLAAIAEALRQRPKFVAAHPDRQPDAPSDGRRGGG